MSSRLRNKKPVNYNLNKKYKKRTKNSDNLVLNNSLQDVDEDLNQTNEYVH